MRKSKFSADQIVRMLREAEQSRAQGRTIAEICQAFGVSDQTYHRWRAKYGGMDVGDARRLKAAEEEIRRLKKIVADQAVSIDILKEVAEGNFGARPGAGRR